MDKNFKEPTQGQFDLSPLAKYYKECVEGGDFGWIMWENGKPVYYKSKTTNIPPLFPGQPVKDWSK